MNIYTEKEALEEIFNTKLLSNAMRTYKARYSKGILSRKAIENLLKKHNFVIHQEAIYKKD